jgi:hypothetical protein
MQMSVGVSGRHNDILKILKMKQENTPEINSLKFINFVENLPI